MPSDKDVLMYGIDVHLADVRRLVLQQAGFRVNIVCNVSALRAEVEAGSKYAVLLCCYTVPQDEAAVVAEAAQKMNAELYPLGWLTQPKELIEQIKLLADRHARHAGTIA